MTNQPQQNNILRAFYALHALRARLREPRNLLLITLGAAAVILLAFIAHGIFAIGKTPPPAALETAAAETLRNRYGGLYTLAHLTPGPALDRPPPKPETTSPIQPASDNPVSPISPVSPIETAPAPDGHVHYIATITARLSEALYSPVNTADYIARELKFDTSVERKTGEIINGPGGVRIRELAGINANINVNVGADSPASMRLIRETARTGARVEMRAHIEASRTRSGWQINIASLTPKTPLPEGEPLGTFSGRLLDVTRESDLATLRRLAAQAGETLRRVEAARDRYRSELAASASRLIAAALTQLTPGTLYSGKATLPGLRTTPNLCLEITSLDRAASTLRANLRADSSWIATRPLEGRYACDSDTGIFTLTFSANRGVPLADTADLVIVSADPFRITLRLDGAGLSGDTGAWSCKLARVPDAGRNAAMTIFGAAEHKLLDATRPGFVYRVLTAGEPDLLLRFQTQDTATGALTATIENARDPWKRELQGTLTAGPARVNDFPLRLLSTLDPAQTSVPPIGLSVRLENGNIFKGSMRMRDTQPVTLEPADPRYLAELESLAREREEQERAVEQDIAARQNAATEQDIASGQNATATVASPGNVSRPTPPSRPTRPARPAPPVIAPPVATVPVTTADTSAPPPLVLPAPPAPEGAYIWDETAWKPLPVNNARIVRSTLQKAGGIWKSTVSLIKTRPEKQETGTLTFDGAETPPAVFRHDVTIAFRGAFETYAGTPAGKFPIEVVQLEIKSKGRKRIAELNRLGAAAATFGKKSEPIVVERSVTASDLYIIRVRRHLPTGRYALHAPGHSFEFEIGK